MKRLLTDFEVKTGLGPTKAAKFLGVAYSTYCQYKRGDREVPEYVKRHIEDILDTPDWVVNKLLKKRIYGEAVDVRSEDL